MPALATSLAASQSLLAVLLFAALTLCLVAGIAALRFTEVQFRGHRINTFTPWGDDVSAFSGRLCRAHANCYENLPIFLAIVGVALASGQAHITGPLALWCVGARFAQSVVHLCSTRSRWVMVRFSFMIVQVAIQASWVYQLVRQLVLALA